MIKIKPLKQTKSYCGPYCLKLIFDYYGLNVEIKEIAKISKTVVKESNSGTSPQNMVVAAKHFGFKAKYKENSSIKEIEKLIKKGIPVIVNWFSDYEGHYSIVADIDKTGLYIIDPEYGKKVFMKWSHFEKVWFDYKGDYIKSKKDVRIRPIIIINKY